MLVVTRNPGESVVLTDSDGVFLAKFTYVEKCGVNKMRVGIEAGLDIQIARSEIMGRPNGGKKPAHTRLGQSS
jgi:sRNA-binding carbon storage regulator CsrA